MNDEKINAKKVAGSLIWSFGERITAQLVSTIVTIVLARLLDPEHYGIISIVTVFISLCNVFVTSGFGTALVQKKEADDLDFDTAFVLSLGISILLYAVLFLCAPYISLFFDMHELKAVTRVMALRLPIASINSIQQASVQRKMQFRKFFVSTLFGTVISGFLGVFLAYNGFGVWALVFQYLSNVIIDTIVLCCVGEWKPKFMFSSKKAKYIFSFGSKVLATNLVFTIEGDIRSLIIGKVFGTSDLAYYDQGKKYPSLIVTNVNSAMTKVMLPTYSKNQEDLKVLKKMLRKSIQIGTYVLSPVLIGFAACSPTFVQVILTEKWSCAIIFMQIFALSYITRPFETALHQALLAIGRSALVLKLMIVTSMGGLFAVFVGAFYFRSTVMIAVVNLFSAVFSFVVFSEAGSKNLNYSLKEQLVDIAPSLIISLFMGGTVYLLNDLCIQKVLLLPVQVLVGGVFYLFASVVTKNKSFRFLVKNFLKR